MHTNHTYANCTHTHWHWHLHPLVHTVWPEILAGRYFGGLLKICHLAEYTLAVERVLAIMIFITKWLVKRAGNLPGRELVSTQLRQNWWWNATENVINRCYAYSVLLSSRRSLQRPHTRRLDRLPCADRQANSSPTSDAQNSGEVMPSYVAFNGELHAED